MLLRSMLIAVALSSLASGWGETGHRIVARLAAAEIRSPAARARILALLDQDSDTACRQADFAERLACVSTWADDIKRTTRRDTRNWHFVDIPRAEAAYDEQRDCKTTPGGDCLVNAVVRQFELLANPPEGTSGEAKAEAVKFLVHLLGDLTQPLHCISDHDGGGNGKIVTWYGESDNQWGHWNLHSVWDDGMLARSEVTDLGYTKVLLGRKHLAATRDPMKALAGWAVEGHDAAIAYAYADLPAPLQGRLDGSEHTDRMYYVLGAEYKERNLAALELQLMRGGRRLADVMNRLFAPAH